MRASASRRSSRAVWWTRGIAGTRADDTARRPQVSRPSPPRTSRRPSRREARDERVRRPAYFLAWQRFVDDCQTPPAFTQSAWLVIVESELPDVPLLEGLPDGLADGEVEEPDGEVEEPDGEVEEPDGEPVEGDDI